jgi:hypothetical protein
MADCTDEQVVLVLVRPWTNLIGLISGLVKVGLVFGVEPTGNGTDMTGFMLGATFTSDNEKSRSSSDSSSKPK